MKIWDSPKTEKKAIIFFKDKGLLSTTKECVNGYTTTLHSYKKEHFWKFNNRPCLKIVNLPNFLKTKSNFTTFLLKYYYFIIFCFISLALSKV